MGKRVARVRFDPIPGGKRITFQSQSPRGTYFAVGAVEVMTTGLAKAAKTSKIEAEIQKRMAIA